ncbi:MAG: GNA1162 family protein [Desulfuromonadales bacterium]
MARLILWMLFVVALSACAPTLKMEQYGKGLQEIGEDDFPRQIVILPFGNEANEPGLEAVVRRNFANHFSSKNYLDMKLPVADEKLVHFEKATGKKINDANQKELSEALGVDGLLYGNVTDYKKIYAGIYSQLGVEAEVWLVNARTGKEIFRLRESVRYHEGGVPTSILSAVVTAISTALNLREIQKVRMVNELCYKFMEKIPASRTAVIEARPVIKEVLTNVIEGPFGPKKVIRVGLEGDPGLVATFNIGNFRKGIAMKELKPGIYTGEYAVMPGDNTRDMPVTVTLTRLGGYENQWLAPEGYVSIDTTPPPTVKGVRVKGFGDRIDLSWENLKDIPDLKGYRILRSESPLSGYKELALVELSSYRDTTLLQGKEYYYRIIAVDQVGNEADPGESPRASLAAIEPRKLAGELKEDTLLDGPCLITGLLIVPKGITLTVEKDARLLFEAGAGIFVKGTFSVKGDEIPVELYPAGNVEWQGITVEGGRISLVRVKLRGAVTGITVSDAEGNLNGIHISGSETGLAISGNATLEVKNIILSGNKTGLRLSKTAISITGAGIIQNGDGIIADSYAGELRDNSIIDNQRNIVADKSLSVGPNYFGTVIAEDMRLVNASAEKVFNAPLPTGTVVAAVINPYLKLTQEERQKKSAEFFVEGGNYFRQRNYGKAVGLFAENLKVLPTAETYFYLSLCHQEMKEEDKALAYLRDGTAKFPQDPLLWKSLGMLVYEKGDEAGAKKALQEVLRLSPDDRQARFVLERITADTKK